MVKRFKNWLALASVMLMGLIAVAQEKKVDVDIDLNKDGGGGNWYQQPWIWIVGGAVFILLLVAILRGGSRRAE